VANETGSDWLTIAWEVVKYTLAALGAVASSAALWVARRYGGHLAMLLKHESRFKETDEELGRQLAFRTEAAKGLIGDKLSKQIDELKEEDKRIRSRVSKNKKDTDEKLTILLTQQAGIRTDISWLCRELGKKDHEEP
jgi:gas vesicle protein